MSMCTSVVVAVILHFGNEQVSITQTYGLGVNFACVSA